MISFIYTVQSINPGLSVNQEFLNYTELNIDINRGTIISK